MEQNLSKLNNIAAKKEGVIDLKANYDIDSRKIGRGKPYNRSSGYGVLIGQRVEISWFMGHKLVIASSLR